MGTKDASELLPGTLDLLILKTLVAGRMHGYCIAQRLKNVSEDVLQVGESSLYPALQRLLLRGWVKAEWGASENNRRARYYTLTPAGRKQLAVERQEFDLVGIGVIIGTGVSLWVSRFVAALLYGLEPRDPATLISATLVLASVGALAGLLPAWRASRIDPARVLRES